jgi:hypothetical protein
MEQIHRNYEKWRGLLVPSLTPGDVLSVQLNSTTPDGIEIDEDRIITGTLAEKRSGLVLILEDTAKLGNLEGEEVNFASLADKVGELESQKFELWKGFILLNAAVAIDTEGRQFDNPFRDNVVYPVASYAGVSVNLAPVFGAE